MPNIYVRSTTGNDSNDGLTWATAKATLLAAAAALTAGDTLFVSQSHNEPSSTARSITFPGTPNRPNRLICVLDTDATPSTEATATISSSGTSVTSIQGSVYLHGLLSTIGSGSSITSFGVSTSSSIDTIQSYNNCDFLINGTSTATTNVVNVGSSSTGNTAKSRVIWNNCNLKLNTTGHQLALFQDFTWRGGKLIQGVSTPSYFMRVGAQGRGAPALIEGVDFSEVGNTIDLVSGSLSAGRVTFRNCILPTNWTGQLVQGTIDPGLRVEMHNCDSANTNYRLWVAAFSGSIKSETSIIKMNGANDGTIGFSWKMDTNTNPTSGMVGLESPEIAKWNEAVGSSITVSVDVLTDGVALNNSDVWLDVQYLGDTASPKSLFLSGKISPLATSSLHPSSTATWNTTGMSSPQKQKLSVSFTPRKVGMLLCKIYFAKASTTLYVDPKIQVT